MFQARKLEWVAISSSRGSYQSRDWTHVFWGSCISRRVLYHGATWEAILEHLLLQPHLSRSPVMWPQTPGPGTVRARLSELSPPRIWNWGLETLGILHWVLDNGSDREPAAMSGTHTCQHRECRFEEKERKMKQMQGAAGTRDCATLRRETGRLGLTHTHCSA